MTTVLLVDDNEDSRFLFAKVLEDAGFRVVTAADGVECIRAARERRPNVILLDIEMPNMDGRQALEVLRREPETADTPIIAVTGATRLQVRGDLDELGFAAVLLKPVKPNVFLAAVRQALGYRAA
jgi:CheY-like chemotaxis protein